MCIIFDSFIFVCTIVHICIYPKFGFQFQTLELFSVQRMWMQKEKIVHKKLKNKNNSTHSRKTKIHSNQKKKLFFFFLLIRRKVCNFIFILVNKWKKLFCWYCRKEFIIVSI